MVNMVREDNKYEDVRIVCYLLRLVWSHVEVGLKPFHSTTNCFVFFPLLVGPRRIGIDGKYGS